MICDNCDGTGKSQTGSGCNCFICNGTGHLCDVCGERCERGSHVCLADDCQEQDAANNQNRP
jgi:hypothetical protein